MKVNFNTVTGGNGFWSNVVGRRVRITELNLLYVNEGSSSGELVAYFNPDDWYWREDGLIYTDKLWLSIFRQELVNIGFSEEAAESVDYSEQGMQRDEYVSMDVDSEFIREYNSLLAQ